MKPWEARQRKRGLWGALYRWYYGEAHRDKIREELRKRREGGMTKRPHPGGSQDGGAVDEQGSS